MLNVKTRSGFKWKVNEKVITDWRFIKALANADSGDGSKQLAGLTKIVNMLLGDDGEEALCQHIEKNGIVDQTELYANVMDILNAIREHNESSKNSLPSPR